MEFVYVLMGAGIAMVTQYAMSIREERASLRLQLRLRQMPLLEEGARKYFGLYAAICKALEESKETASERSEISHRTAQDILTASSGLNEWFKDHLVWLPKNPLPDLQLRIAGAAEKWVRDHILAMHHVDHVEIDESVLEAIKADLYELHVAFGKEIQREPEDLVPPILLDAWMREATRPYPELGAPTNTGDSD